MPHVNGVGNGSEPMVPNPQFGTVGRPPVASDEELLKLATKLNDKLGRPPTAPELIEAAGGCQKKRALAAINELKLGLARLAVQSELIFPRTIEASLRGLMAQWMEHAAGQLAVRHQAEAQRVDNLLGRSEAHAEEQRVLIGQLRENVADRDRMVGELLKRIEGLSEQLTRVSEEKLRIESVANERDRLIHQLTATK